MGTAGRRRVIKCFSVERMMSGLTAVYGAAAQRAAGSVPVLMPS